MRPPPFGVDMRLTGSGRDEGFTLIELLVAVTILGVIAFPLANAVIGYLRNSDATTDRMALSHDAQISAAFFSRDVAGVGLRDLAAAPAAGGTVAFKSSIQLNAAYDAGGLLCGSAATPTAQVRFLSDDWDSTTSPATRSSRIVAYYLTSTTTVGSLHRLSCAGSAVTDVVIAHYVDPATLSVTCSTSCASSTVPQTVTLAFSATRPTVGAYPITLAGQRRQQ
jgi:prepilin-type N-terminal cleavage/methylation domain-containing protein